jgi:AcrR family transcriptional regulator
MGMGRPRLGTHKVDTAERILRAAEDEFAARGFAQAGLAEIAARAKVTRPSLLYHFESKDALYRAVLERVLGRLATILEGVAFEGDFHARLEGLVRAFSTFVKSDPAVASLFIRAAIDTGGPGRRLVRELTAPILDGIVAFVEENARELPRGLPARAAVMQIVASALLREASGPLAETLFGEGDRAWDVARHTFAQDSVKRGPK